MCAGVAERRKVVDGKDLIAFLCKLNSILIASTTMKTVVCYSGKVLPALSSAKKTEEGKKLRTTFASSSATSAQ